MIGFMNGLFFISFYNLPDLKWGLCKREKFRIVSSHPPVCCFILKLHFHALCYIVVDAEPSVQLYHILCR